MKEYVAVVKKYVDFKGRAGRQEYWMFTLYNFIISVILSAMNLAHPAFGIVYFIYTLALFLPSLGVAVRRLHDINRTGWWLAAPFGCGILAAISAAMQILPLLILFITGTIGLGITLFVFACFRGDEGDNRFGSPDPIV